MGGLSLPDGYGGGDGPGGGDDVARLLGRLRAVGPARVESGEAPPPFVGRVLVTAAPGRYLTVRRVAVYGGESEGAAGLLVPDLLAPPVAVYAVGPGTPAVGEDLVCRWVDHRWVCDRRGPRPNRCGTDYPSVLHLSAWSPSDVSTFVGYNPTPFTTGPFDLTWGPRPGGMPDGSASGGGSDGKLFIHSNVFTGINGITFPMQGWYGPPIPITFFGGGTGTAWIYLGVNVCKAFVWTICTGGASYWFADGNTSPNVFVLGTPAFRLVYQSGPNLHATITGTLAGGGADHAPDPVTGNVGFYVTT